MNSRSQPQRVTASARKLWLPASKFSKALAQRHGTWSLHVECLPVRMRLLQEARRHDAGGWPPDAARIGTPSASGRWAPPMCRTTSRFGGCGSTSASRSTMRRCPTPPASSQELRAPWEGSGPTIWTGLSCTRIPRASLPGKAGAPIEVFPRRDHRGGPSAPGPVSPASRASPSRSPNRATPRLLTVVTKSNAQPGGMVMWDKIAAAVAAEFPEAAWDECWSTP